MGLLIVLGAVLLAGACRPSQRDWKSSVDLADFVAHQGLNLSTDLISPAEGVGLDRIGSGWQLRDDEGGEPIAEMPRQLGRLRVFSPEADLASVEVELGLSPAAGSGAVKVSVNLNREPLADLDVVKGWTSYRMEVPAERVRPGLNVLDFRDVERTQKRRRVRLRRARLSSRSGRGPHARAGRPWTPGRLPMVARCGSPRPNRSPPGRVLPTWTPRCWWTAKRSRCSKRSRAI